MKTMLSFKPVQMRPNREMVLIHNNYVKTSTVRFTLILIGLSHILSWQDGFMSWIHILIASLFDFNLQNDMVISIKSGYNSFEWNDFDQSQSILFAQFAITNDRIILMNSVTN
jgi:hypothetical protein